MGAENRRMMAPRADWIHTKAQNTGKSSTKTTATPHAHQNIPSTTYFKKFAHLHQNSPGSKVANVAISSATTKPKQQQQHNRRLMIASKGHALFNTMRMLQRNNVRFDFSRL
jgi:transketolase N-terminal domain/subunit